MRALIAALLLAPVYAHAQPAPYSQFGRIGVGEVGIRGSSITISTTATPGVAALVISTDNVVSAPGTIYAAAFAGSASGLTGVPANPFINDTLTVTGSATIQGSAISVSTNFAVNGGSVFVGTTTGIGTFRILTQNVTGLARAIKIDHASPSTNNSGAVIKFSASASDAFGAEIGGGREGAGGAGFLTFRTGLATPVERIRITDAGLVGISTGSPQAALDVHGVATFGQTAKSSFTAAGVLQLPTSAHLTVGGVAVLPSSRPVHHVSAGSFTQLVSGTTFQFFTPDSAIILRRISATVVTAGSGGAGDVVKCNDSTGNGISVTMTDAAAAGTSFTAIGLANVAYQAAVYCHLDTAASTRPTFNVALEYMLQ